MSANRKNVAWRYRFEPDLQWHVVAYENDIPKKVNHPLLEVEPLGVILDLEALIDDFIAAYGAETLRFDALNEIYQRALELRS